MVSVCLPSDAPPPQHLPSYLGFSYLGRGVSLHGCSSKAQLLLLTLDKGYLLPPPFLTFSVGGCHGAHSVAERSYPTSKVRGGGREERPHIQGLVSVWAQEGVEELFHVQSQEVQQ